MTEKKDVYQPLASLEDALEYTGKARELLRHQYSYQPLAFVHSYGCQQNVSDSEKFKGLLAEMGYGFTENPEDADIVFYNTCAVRENAEKRVFGNVGALKRLKNRRPEMIIAIAGCMTQQQQVADKLKKSYPYVDMVVGTNAFSQFPKLMYDHLNGSRRYIKSGDGFLAEPIMEGLPVRRDGTLKAWVPVMYGCDNFCAYCIVPYVRGRERSRSSESVVAEVRGLVEQGYKEITLLGQNVNSYGKGLKEEINFSGLLRKINALDGEFRIRFMTSHPKDCTRELIDTIADCEKVCNHLHLPVQSGSDRVVKEMNRHYTIGQYLELVDYARQKIPDLSLTSDIIVGFPGETYEEFRQTLELIEKVRYTALFTFIFSPRSGTRAEKMEDPVPAEEKSRWFQELLDTQGRIGEEIMQSYVGKTIRVLPDGESRTEGVLSSRSEQNLIVEFPGDKSLIGQFCEVKIERASNCVLYGTRV